MRKLFFLMGFVLVIGTGWGCQQVQKPELNGEGPLAIKVSRGIAVPEYHAPADRWRIQHKEALDRGDFTRRECMLCHDPRTGCNQCHQYAGVKPIFASEASLYWPTEREEK